MPTNESVTIWTREATKDELGRRLGGMTPNGASWTKEVFENVGWDDLVRTYAGFYIGSGPGESDMALTSEVVSEPVHDGSHTVNDTTRQMGAGDPAERDRAVTPVYLGVQLSAVARGAGHLIITKGPQP